MKQFVTAFFAKSGILGSALCLAVFVSSAPAQAAEETRIHQQYRTGTNITSNFYLGANLGTTNLGYTNLGYSRTQEFDASTSVYGLFGGYHINDILAVDVSWTDLGQPADSEVGTDISLLQLGMLGKVPVRTDLTLFGRVGLNMWSYDLGEPFSNIDNNTDAYIGIGADYNINGRPALRFGLDFYSLNLDLSNGQSTEKDNISEFSIGIMFSP